MAKVSVIALNRKAATLRYIAYAITVSLYRGAGKSWGVPVGVQKGLRGKIILVVEDSPLVAIVAQEILVELGCKVVGPAGTMADALRLCEQGDFDAALVDLNIRGAKAFPLLTILARRQIPFILVTGYADWSMPDEWSRTPRMPKPFNREMADSSLLNLFEEELPRITGE